MKISIVIPNYNGKHLLKKNLPSVIDAAEYYLNGKNDSVEIIIADDYSTDDSVDFIKNQIANNTSRKIQLTVIPNKKNVGFASNVNNAVKAAQGEIVVLLNTDITPEKEFLHPLLKHFDDPQLFAVGCMDRSIENGKTILRGRGLGKWHRGFLIHRRGEVDKTTTLWVSGGSGAFRKTIWERLTGFNPLYNPFYWEDIDLSYRAVKSGYRVLFEPKSIVIHQHEEGSIKQHATEKKIKAISYRNQLLFVWVNSDLSVLLFHLFWMPFHILYALKNDRIYFLGLLYALSRIPAVLSRRKANKKVFKLSDTEVIRSLRK